MKYSFFSRKEGLQQKPLKNTTHPQKELEKELEKELGKELEGNWDGQMELGHSHYPGQKWNWKKTGLSTLLKEGRRKHGLLTRIGRQAGARVDREGRKRKKRDACDARLAAESHNATQAAFVLQATLSPCEV